MKKKVHDLVARITTWSMRAALKGKFPHIGPFGESLNKMRSEKANTEICPGFRFAYFGFKSDAKARRECHRFDRSYSHCKVCETCFAEKPNKHGDPLLTFKNFFPGSAHSMTELTHNEYISCADELSPWNSMPGFHVKGVFRDPMHNIYLGTSKELVASALGYWNHKQYLVGPNLAERLRIVSAKQKQFCTDAGLKGPWNTFTPSNTGLGTPSEYPELGSCFKAAGMKSTIFFCAHLAREISEANPEEGVAQITF